MPQPLSCPTCNAGLPEGAPGSSVQCQFCGTHSVLPGQPAPEPAAPPPAFGGTGGSFSGPGGTFSGGGGSGLHVSVGGPGVELGGPDQPIHGLRGHTATPRQRSGALAFGVALVIAAIGAAGVWAFSSDIERFEVDAQGTVEQPAGLPGAAQPTLAPAVAPGDDPIEVIGEGLFEDVREIGVAADGILVAAEFSTGVVRRISGDGQVVGEFDALEDGVVVQEMAVGRDGRVHIVQGFDVRAYTAAGERLPDVTYPSDDPIVVRDGVARLPDGGLLVVERGATLVRLDAAGAVTSRVPVPLVEGGGPGITRASVDPGGLVAAVVTRFVDDGIEEGLHLLSADGELLRTITTGGGLSGLSDVAVDDRGRIAVTTLVQGVEVWSPSGELVVTLPVVPAHGVAWADDGTLWVAAGDRVERWAVPASGQ